MILRRPLFFCATGLALAFALCAVCSCASDSAPKPAVRSAKVAGLKNLVVVPFQDMTAIYGPGKEVRSPVSGSLYFTGPVASGATVFLTGELQRFLEATSYNILPYQDAADARTQALVDTGSKAPEQALLVATGQRMGADAVAAGFIYRFEEREGTSYSVVRPASAAFDLFLIRVADGAVLWSCRFDETQKPLSDNLLDVSKFMKRHGAWVTVNKLASQGLSDKLATFPQP
ncbi:MAG: hypothetical protein AB1921_16945 [Thermodesulfobacteriota bacterium]